MLTIRREQIDEIGRRLAVRWEDTMVVHLEAFFPDECKELGEQGVRDAITLGQKKAARYDIHTERDVCIFLNFMFAYGFEFDNDPEIPWAKEILTNPNYTRANLKTYLLEKASEGEYEADMVAFAPPTEEEIEGLRQAQAATEAAREEQMNRALAAERVQEEARGADLAREIEESGMRLDPGDDNGST